MLCQQIDRCDSRNLLTDFQSTYRKNYSTETSLIKIINDILWAVKNQRAILQDLSAAFDMIDHNVLIYILKEHYSFGDKALHWFKEYLRPWNFKVCIKMLKTKTPGLQCATSLLLWCQYVHLLLHPYWKHNSSWHCDKWLCQWPLTQKNLQSHQ